MYEPSTLDEFINDGMFVGVDIRDCIVMQYTGVDTLDGDEIYEGDIIPKDILGKGFELKTGEIEFVGGSFGVKLANDSGDAFLPLADLERSAIEKIKILGNKYEQPELLQPPQ